MGGSPPGCQTLYVPILGGTKPKQKTSWVTSLTSSPSLLLYLILCKHKAICAPAFCFYEPMICYEVSKNVQLTTSFEMLNNSLKTEI